VFVGRWLLLDKAADAAILGDRAAATVVDELRALYPLGSAHARLSAD
jgi:hypothetical protein